jgi:hypothetical protein
MIACEYCDARVEVGRRAATKTTAPARHVAAPHYSGFAWGLLLFAVVTVAGGAFVFVAASPTSTEAPVTAADATEARPAVVAEVQPVASPATPARPAAEPEPAPTPEEPSPAPVVAPTPKTPAAHAGTGPVISVAQAKAQLEPKVLACMRANRTYSLLAYMGNNGVGAVTVLSDSRTRVDGRTAKVAGTKLGRCMNEAGKSVRTRANKSNYVRFELRNAAVPDPLAGLPAKADRKAVAATIVAKNPDIVACARKHGEEGSREVFYFKIDGPTGKVTSVRGSYRSRAFRSCAEAIYRKLSFAKVQEPETKYTHDLQM